MRKVDGCLERGGDLFVLAKLFAVIHSDGVHPRNERPQQRDTGVFHFGGSFGLELTQASELGLPLDQAEDAALMSGANDGVHFPVTETTLAGDDRRPLLDAGAIGDLAPTNVAAVAFALLLLAAQLAM